MRHYSPEFDNIDGEWSCDRMISSKFVCKFMIIKPFLEDIGPKKKQSCSLGHVCTTTIDNIDETGAMIEW